MEGLIDRQKAINKIVFGIDDKAYFGDADIDWKVIDFLNSLPSVTPQEKTAAWVPTDEEPHEIYECNACGWLLYDVDRTDFNFCPNCGARMQEVEENG